MTYSVECFSGIQSGHKYSATPLIKVISNLLYSEDSIVATKIFLKSELKFVTWEKITKFIMNSYLKSLWDNTANSYGSVIIKTTDITQSIL